VGGLFVPKEAFSGKQLSHCLVNGSGADAINLSSRERIAHDLLVEDNDAFRFYLERQPGPILQG
jgi:hypothetical protein